MARPAFEKTARQREALDVLNRNRHGLLYGGSRSGKTVVAVRNVFLRAAKKTSRHLIGRYRFNHAKTSLGMGTIPWVLRSCFPGLPAQANRTDWYWTVPAADGGTSEVWLGGTDDSDRVEKILGNEYSTIYLNECSQIPFDAVATLWTRLAENSGLKQRFYYDCNPPGLKHWSHALFFDGKLPDGTEWAEAADSGRLQMNPGHNRENLTDAYLSSLEALPLRMKKRFLEGEYLADVEGALWTDELMTRARLLEVGKVLKTAIAVDPSVSDTDASDECGIVVCSLHEDDLGSVRADFSDKMSTAKWAKRVVSAYYSYDAAFVVAEVNQGGDLVEDAIHREDRHVKVVKVRAADSKRARAEPVSMLFEKNEVRWAADMPLLENELTTTDFDKCKVSPNRLDAMVWGLTQLMLGRGGKKRIRIG